MLHLILAAALAAGDSPSPAPATPATSATTLHHEITVESAAASPAPLELTAPSVTVIGPDEIRSSGAVAVADLLRRVAGVDVSRPGSRGKATLARVDGASSTQTLVLVDGVEINSPALGVADLADLTLDNVERIEVVRGPMSALHGSAAMGGVIQIFTRRGQGRAQGSAELQGGSFATLRGAASLAGGAGERGGWSLALSRESADGRTFDTPSGPLEHDAYDNRTVSGALTLGLGQATTLALDGRYIDAERDLPVEVFGVQAFDQNSTQSDEQGLLAARLATRAGRFAPSFRVGLAAADQLFDDPIDPGEDGPFAGDFRSRVQTRRLEAVAESGVELGAQDRLVLGVGFESRHAENEDNLSGLNFDRSFDTWSAFAENRLEARSLLGKEDALVLQLGLRVDDIEDYGSTASPKASLLWQAAGREARVRLGVGRGFRAPSLNELAFPFYGNPELEPESSWTWEAGVGGRWAGGRVDGELRGFRSDFDDLITTDPETFTAVNLDRARVEGLELTLRAWPLAELWLSASGTLQRAEDRATGEELLRRPERKLSLALGWERAEHYRLELSWLATSASRDLVVAGFPERNPGWNRLDAAGAVTLPMAGRRLELFGRVENLLDQEYSEQTGFPAPGIGAWAGLRARI